jgi:hypothetical protein
MTTPAASCPITAGNGTNLRFPSIAFKSLAHKPLAAIFTKTSPAFGESKSNSETSNWDQFYTLSNAEYVVNTETKTVTGTITATPISDVDAWTIVRRMRNSELAASDWTQLPDGPLSTAKKTEWSVYRQELRDITTQQNPREITWPTPVV